MTKNKRKRSPRKRNRGSQRQPSQNSPPPAPVVVDVPNANRADTATGDGGANQQVQQKPRRCRWNNRCVNTCFAGAVALFAFAQVLVGAWQWHEMRRTANQTQQQLSFMWLAMRPQLSSVAPELIEPLTDGDPTKCRFHIYNAGQTGAWLVKVSVIGIVTLPENEIFYIKMNSSRDLPKNEVTTNMNVPAQKGATYEYTMKGLTRQHFEDITSGKHVLYVLARFTYIDQRGDVGNFDHFYKWEPQLRRLVPHPGVDPPDAAAESKEK